MMNRMKSLPGNLLGKKRQEESQDGDHESQQSHSSERGGSSSGGGLPGSLRGGVSSLRGVFHSITDTLSPPRQGEGDVSADSISPSFSASSARWKRQSYGAGVSESGMPAAVRIVSPKTREEILEDLNEQYYRQDFDALSFEMKGLPFDVDEEMLEGMVRERVALLEVLNEHLSDEVQSRSDSIVAGIGEVASVEHEVQVAHIVARNARRNLGNALDEVAANTRIAEKTREKQMLLETLQVLVKLQSIANLARRHGEYEDVGDFARAISTCDECISTLASDPDLCQLKVANALADAACDRYRITMKEMDTALLAVCGEFRQDLYAKILNAYKGLPDYSELAQKVQACFSKVVDTSVSSVVWSYIMQRGYRSDRSSSLTELCKLLPSEIFRPCLSKVLEVVFDILRSHWMMQQWHMQQLEEARVALEVLMAKKEAWQREAEAEDGGRGGDGEDGGGEGDAPLNGTGEESLAFLEDEELMDTGARYEVLQVVLESGLLDGREGLWDAGARCVQQLLNAPGAAEGEHFLQVLDWMHRFIKVGESFSNSNAGWLLRDCLARQSGAFFDAFHRQNLDALAIMLEKEPWRPLQGCTLPSLRDAVKTAGSEEAASAPGQSGSGSQKPVGASELSFQEWLEMGNPFRDWSASKKRRGQKGASVTMQLGFEGSAETAEPRNGAAGTDTENGAETSNDNSESGQIEPDVDSDETEEVRGDFIDEESQCVRVGEYSHAQASASSRGDQPTITLTTLKLFRWMVSYGQLVRILGNASPHVFKGVCDLFDAYLFHIFQTFGNTSVAQLADEVYEGGGDEVTPRLRKTLMRIAGYPPDYVPKAKPSTTEASAMLAASTTAGQKALQGMRRANLFKSTREKLSGITSSTEAVPPGSPAAGSPEKMMIMSSGNMFALKERSVAVESLMSVAEELHRSRGALQAAIPSTESQRIDHFYSRTVDAASDLQEHIFHTASLRLLDLSRFPARIAESRYDVTEVGCEQSPWVDAILGESRQFSEKLMVAGVGPATLRLMWDKALDATAQTVLEGFSLVKRCTLEGRAGMSLDLQTLIKGLRGVAPDVLEVQTNMRIVDNYIKAFYVPGEELVHWALTHPEYTRTQLVNLVTCIAENSKMKRKALKDLLAQIESAA
mmetsp:Transcript_36959/g.104306  ORF Transcript_36959/g.104306 Transcript_36959/m.104306 type:complete len:1134 (-) Transcript_36959:234-3635(-)